MPRAPIQGVCSETERRAVRHGLPNRPGDDKLGEVKSADANAWNQHRSSLDEVLQKMENAIKAQSNP